MLRIWESRLCRRSTQVNSMVLKSSRTRRSRRRTRVIRLVSHWRRRYSPAIRSRGIPLGSKGCREMSRKGGIRSGILHRDRNRDAKGRSRGEEMVFACCGTGPETGHGTTGRVKEDAEWRRGWCWFRWWEKGTSKASRRGWRWWKGGLFGNVVYPLSSYIFLLFAFGMYILEKLGLDIYGPLQ